jgi:hypothetical protein
MEDGGQTTRLFLAKEVLLAEATRPYTIFSGSSRLSNMGNCPLLTQRAAWESRAERRD